MLENVTAFWFVVEACISIHYTWIPHYSTKQLSNGTPNDSQNNKCNADLTP